MVKDACGDMMSVSDVGRRCQGENKRVHRYGGALDRRDEVVRVEHQTRHESALRHIERQHSS